MRPTGAWLIGVGQIFFGLVLKRSFGGRLPIRIKIFAKAGEAIITGYLVAGIFPGIALAGIMKTLVGQKAIIALNDGGLVFAVIGIKQAHIEPVKYF